MLTDAFTYSFRPNHHGGNVLWSLREAHERSIRLVTRSLLK